MMIVCWVEVYILLKENTETLLVASKETELELIVDKSKYTVKFRYQNTGRSHNRMSDNISFERVEYFT